MGNKGTNGDDPIVERVVEALGRIESELHNLGEELASLRADLRDGFVRVRVRKPRKTAAKAPHR